jgi:hypothetical protein
VAAFRGRYSTQRRKMLLKHCDYLRPLEIVYTYLQ